MPPRRTSILLAGALAGAVLPAFPGLSWPAGAAGAADDDAVLPLPVTASAVTDASTTLTVPVPAGVEPTALIGRLVAPDDWTGSVAFSAAGRTLATVEVPAPGRVSVPLRGVRVGEERTIEIDIAPSTEEQDTRGCYTPTDLVAFEDLRLRFTGTESAPTTVADFLPEFVRGVDVKVASDADADLLEAGLTAVAAIGAGTTTPTPVRLLPDDARTRAGAGHRVVELVAGDGRATTSIDDDGGVPTLRIEGGTDELVDAARALGNDALALADAARTEGLAASAAEPGSPGTVTLDDLGYPTLGFEGWGQTDLFIDVRQDVFGTAVDGFDLHLTGAHTALPEDARGQLDVYVNDSLVTSTDLTDDPELDLDVTVPADLLRADTTVRLAVSAAPPTGDCDGPAFQLPFELAVDGAASTVTAGEGDPADGFDAFPQALGGTLAVGLPDDDALAAAAEAAQVLLALQRSAARPLGVDVMSTEDFVGGDAPGLLVGADETASDDLGAPLVLSRDRQVRSGDQIFEVGTDTPYAALEAFDADGREVLLLGSWSPDGAAPDLSGDLADQVAEDGWSSLGGDLLVTTGDGAPLALDSAALAAETGDADDDRSFAWWFLGGLLALVALLVVRAIIARRRGDEIPEIARMDQEPEGGDEDDDEPGPPA
ncbi:cellulose biosynthesis cyclic di-GMP-binding regulatory protein BcsB [Nocardioides sp. YIM 152588]|uniref:cellulose biosynthesis cyclic di-GMP-binding regulatory protein BcsB n=1 Tax=Nocardioides sp. YIM 152588 TaxID=3158259 RepID=UPI0032E42E02